MDLPFLQPMDIDPSGPSGQARRASFLSFSVAITEIVYTAIVTAIVIVGTVSQLRFVS